MQSKKLRFLWDENVKKTLNYFLKNKGFDTKFCTGGMSDTEVSSLTISEKRILITNDYDFLNKDKYPSDKLYGLILLRLPQNDNELLLRKVNDLLNENDLFKGGHIILK